MIIARFIRVSTDEQTKRRTSPKPQRDAFEKWSGLQDEDCELDVFNDLGYSGKLTSRPALQGIQDACTA